jgi:L-iditol 2-dehydrogenase
MKAAVLYGRGDIRYADWERPEPGPGEIRVRVRAAGICGSDIPRVLGDGAHFYPIVLGHEFSGTVDAVGEGVTGFAPGDTVSGAPLKPCMSCPDCARGNYALCRRYSFIGSREQGAFAEYVCLPAANAVRFDPRVPFEQAAMFEPAAVSCHGLLCCARIDGEYAAVFGAGTIGLFAARWARIFGARKVAVIDVDSGRLPLAERIGADAVFDASDPGWTDAAMSFTGGEGFGTVIEASGSSAAILSAFGLAAGKASVCCIGTPRSDVVFTPALWEKLNRREFTLTGSWMSYSAPFPGREWQLTAECFADGRLRFDPGMICARFPLSEAKQAFELFAQKGKAKGKVMFAV